ncbi:MAG TPA: hypothetical protein VET30_06215, partial [Pseudoxanthomonas sp.]|nr:hypothetical protein [Pseudoxanthomonas sp.]
MATAFRAPDMRQVVVRRLESPALLLTDVAGGANHGLTGPLPKDEAFLVQLRLLDCPGCDYFADGRHVDDIDHSAGK